MKGKAMPRTKDYSKHTSTINKGNHYVADMWKVSVWSASADTLDEIMVYFHDLTARGFENLEIGHNGTFFTIKGTKEQIDYKATEDYNRHARQMRTIGKF